MPVAKSFNPNTPSPSIPANLMPPPERKPSPRGEGAEAAKPAKRPVGRPRKHVDENAPAKRPVGRPPKRKKTDDDEDEAAPTGSPNSDDPFAEFADGDGRPKAGKRLKGAPKGSPKGSPKGGDDAPKDAAAAAAYAKGVSKTKEKKGPDESSSSEEELNEGEEEIEVRDLQHFFCDVIALFCSVLRHFSVTCDLIFGSNSTRIL